MKKDNSIKKIMIILSALEILLQCIIFVSLTTVVNLALLKSYNISLVMCFLIIIPVVVGYLTRRYIDYFAPFMLVHIVMTVIWALLGNSTTERYMNAVIMVLFTAYSVHLKNRSIKRNDISNMKTDTVYTKERERAAALSSIVQGEKVSFGFLGLMAAGYIVGVMAESQIVMNMEILFSGIFVVFYAVYNNMQKLYQVFSLNYRKNNFPAKQLENVNIFVCAAVGGLLLLGMLLFYNGEYGNIFSLMASAGVWLLRVIVKAFIFLLGIFGKESTEIDSTTQTETTAEEESVFEVIESQGSAILEAVIEGLAFVLVLAMIAAAVYMFRNYVRGFNRSKKQGMDYIENIYDNEENVITEKGDDIRKGKQYKTEKNVRKIYKKLVLKGTKGKQPDLSSTPTELTFENVTKDEALSKDITDIYEKARYSNEEISEDEIKRMKKM